MHKALLYNLLSSIFVVQLMVTIKIVVLHYSLRAEVASFFRHISALFIILPFIIHTLETKPHHFVHKIPHKLMVMRALCYTIATTLWPIVYTNIPLHIATTMAFVVPFLSNFLLSIFLKEKIPNYVWVSKIIAFLGVVVILEPRVGEFNIFYVLALVAIVFWAVATVLNKAIANKGVKPNIALHYLSVYAVIFTFIFLKIFNIQLPQSFLLPFILLAIPSVLSQKE